jgi:hypothetical protein
LDTNPTAGMDRHLTPDELDRLLDGDVGFATPEVERHAQECPQCSADLDALRAVVAQLGRIPEWAPSPLFSDRVMANVVVFEPWYITLGDVARSAIPETRTGRVVAGSLAGVSAAAISGVAALVAANWEMSKLIFGIVAGRVEHAATTAFTATVAGILGDQAAQTLFAQGPLGLGIAAAGGLAVVGMGAVGLRLATRPARRDSGSEAFTGAR